MLCKIEGSNVMGFVKIEEVYPDDYILVKIVEIDHSKGRETGTVLCVSSSREELVSSAKEEGVVEETIILQGVNLTPILGGLL